MSQDVGPRATIIDTFPDIGPGSSRALLLLSRQFIRVWIILLPSLNILGKGQTNNFFRILAQQQPEATVTPTVFDRQSRCQPSWSHSTGPHLEKEKTKKKYTCLTYFRCTTTTFFDKQYKFSKIFLKLEGREVKFAM
ncbi:hypothetical protein L3X38_024780 [Prunus dulcis]|uniref:Uncharacterized protein n=1 Tax=Prunus dulcis TaxID=3755 RepID=A0AAD4W2E0_PRUDU|nr:hypothetical protein L3X38_024780 [Prunus dulcis]